MRIDWNRHLSKFVVSVAVLTAFCLLVLFPFYETARWGFFDLFLRIEPPLPIHPRLRVVEIDDNTFEALRMYPLSRNLVARGIAKMAELGVEVLLVDSEYVEPSPRVVSETYLDDELPRKFDRVFEDLESNTVGLFGALTGQVDLPGGRGFALQLVREWPAYLNQVKADLLKRIQGVAQDNDVLLARALRLHGRAHVTVTPTPFTPATDLSPELRRELLERIALKRLSVIDAAHPIQSWQFVSPAILPILQAARGAGSVAQHVDPDGTRRRIDLLFGWEGAFFPHISFSSLLDWMGQPEVLLYRDRVVLRKAQHPDGGLVDVTLPLDEGGRMLIHWPKGTFNETFPRVSFLKLLRDEDYLERLRDNLELMDRQGWLDLVPGDVTPLDFWSRAERIAEEGGGTSKEYRDLRLAFVEATRSVLDPAIQSRVEAYYTGLLEAPGLGEDFRRDVQRMIDLARESFDASRNLLELWEDNRRDLRERLEGSWVSLGYTGRSTTDVGINPFDPNYMNVGTMAAVVNTVLQNRFLDDRPWYWSLFLVAPVVFFLPSLTRRLNPVQGLAMGLSVVLGVQVLFLLVFVISGIYFDAFFAFGTTLSSWLISYVMHFLKTTREAAYVKDMASQYVSKTVVNLLIQKPELLKLGGEKKVLTAMFTDVKGFSTISEQLSAVELVELLNEYLTAMCDIILEEEGTIDKFEGDAIIAFFNAPLDAPDHAIRACRSALRMKQAEARLNPGWLERKMTPAPLFTRMGINTGEMVHGNMGTRQKKNYTIMGNHVNLAARLEGVNKQYGTAILISENTYEQLEGRFLCRKLDRVRVVGIHKPIRLFELVAEQDSAEPEVRERVERFHEGLARFEARDYAQGAAFFEDFLRKWPGDGPAETFLKRCQEYVQDPPPAHWDGVWNLTTK